MTIRQKAKRPGKKVSLKIIEQYGDKEAPSEVERWEDKAMRKRAEPAEIEIDLSNDELRQGIQVTEVERTRGIVREVATCIIAILFIILIFWKTTVPQAIMLSILGSIVIYFFGKHIGRRS